MRNIVPSSRSGAYRYEREGVDAGVEERFTRLQSDDTSRHTVSRRVAPSGVTIDVDAVEERGEFGWRVRSAKISLQSAASSVSVTWELAGEMLHVMRRIRRPDGAVEEVERDAITAGEAALLSPLLRIFQGDVIHALARRDGLHPTIVPWLLDPTNTDDLLRPLIEKRSAAQLAPNTYVYTGGPYHDDDRFVIDDDGTLASYRFRSPDGAQWTITRDDDVVDAR